MTRFGSQGAIPGGASWVSGERVDGFFLKPTGGKGGTDRMIFRLCNICRCHPENQPEEMQIHAGVACSTTQSKLGSKLCAIARLMGK